MLEAIARDAGLTPERAFEIRWAYTYPDDETLGREMLSPAGIAVLVGPEREQAVAAEIVRALAPYRISDGSYRLENDFHFLIARA